MDYNFYGHVLDDSDCTYNLHAMVGRFIFKIIRAWWSLLTGEHHALMLYRVEICEPCEFRKWIVCGQCGCHLKAKASDPDEKCPHPKGDKWRPKHPLSGHMITKGIESCD